MTTTIRPLTTSDAPAAAAIFFDAIHRGAAKAYDGRQRWAWSGALPDPSTISARIERTEGFAAERDGSFAGFMTLASGSHVDMAYVSPDAMGTGVGTALLAAIEVAARKGGATRLTTDASHIARPFFERHGWRTLQAQEVHRNGVSLTNFAMEKILQPT